MQTGNPAEQTPHTTIGKRTRWLITLATGIITFVILSGKSTVNDSPFRRWNSFVAEQVRLIKKGQTLSPETTDMFCHSGRPISDVSTNRSIQAQILDYCLRHPNLRSQ